MMMVFVLLKKMEKELCMFEMKMGDSDIFNDLV